MRGRGGNGIRRGGNALFSPELGFPNLIFMTLDTPHGPITKFLKNCAKNEVEHFFPPFWCLIQKLDLNSGLLAKNQREISSNKVRRLLWPFGGGKCRKGGNAFHSPKLGFPI